MNKGNLYSALKSLQGYKCMLNLPRLAEN